MLSSLVLNANISPYTKQAMASSALEFSDEVVKETDPLLIDIFTRIESGQSTHEQEEAILMEQWQEMMRKRHE